MNYTRHDLTAHLQQPLERYFRCAAQQPYGLAKDPQLGAALSHIRACIPLPGVGWDREAHVLLNLGEGVAGHVHPEYVALWYIDPGDPPQPVVIEGETVTPYSGECIVMAPGTYHFVANSTSKRPRLAFAMLVSEGLK